MYCPIQSMLKGEKEGITPLVSIRDSHFIVKNWFKISRVKIDNLNTQSQNELLQKKLNELIAELKEKEKEV